MTAVSAPLGTPPAPLAAKWRAVGHDRVAVHASPPAVVAMWATPHLWGQWWPQVRWYPPVGGHNRLRVSANPTAADGTVEIRGGLTLLRVALERRDERPGQGWRWRLRGDVEALSELWFEPHAHGVVVHHLLWSRRTRPSDGCRRWRNAMRQGLWNAKDAAQSHHRRHWGLQP